MATPSVNVTSQAKEKTRLSPAEQAPSELLFPSYWPEKGWKKLWGGSDDEDALDQKQFIALFSANAIDPDHYDSAILSRTSEVGQAICSYIEKNVVLKSYKAPEREATRMGWAAKIAANDKKDYSDAWVKSAQERLREGQKGGPAPPQSGPVEIRKIRLLRNFKRWAGYLAMREHIEGEITPGTALRTIRFVTGTPTAGKLPVLEPNIGEVLLFHGTSKETMKKIAATGFDPTFCVNKGTNAKPNFGALGEGSTSRTASRRS